MKLLKCIQKRRSIREFTSENVTDDQVSSILFAGMCAPSGCNIKGYNFVVVRDRNTLKKLSKIGKWVNFIDSSNVGIVVTSKEYTFWIEDCALVTGYMSLEAVNQGLGSCWADVKDGKELDNTDREPLVRDILGISNDQRVLCILAVGYPALKLPEHAQKEFDTKKVHFEKW